MSYEIPLKGSLRHIKLQQKEKLSFVTNVLDIT